MWPGHYHEYPLLRTWLLPASLPLVARQIVSPLPGLSHHGWAVREDLQKGSSDLQNADLFHKMGSAVSEEDITTLHKATDRVPAES